MYAYANKNQKQSSKNTVQKKEVKRKNITPNFTGIPDQMKTNFENYSGFSFDDVHIHYNSDKPAQLQSLAYTQGNHVYIAPGQEKHLAHELGHVVQQKQGKVNATANMSGIAMNDNASLEQASDQIANNSLSFSSKKASELLTTFSSKSVVQRKLFKDPQNAAELIKSQQELQENSEEVIAEHIKTCNPDDEGAYTTVGFEHEFARFDEGQYNNKLHQLTHVELAESQERLQFTDLPFKLETDLGDTIELVGAPFIIATPKDSPVPFSNDIKQVDNLMQEALKKISNPPATFDTMKENFVPVMGLNFDYKTDILITYHNFNSGAFESSVNTQIVKEDFKDLIITSGSKLNNIGTQVNFATNAFTYDIAKDVSDIKSNGTFIGEYKERETTYWNAISEIISSFKTTSNIIIFLKELAKNLSQHNAVEYQNSLNLSKLLLSKSKEDRIKEITQKKLSPAEERAAVSLIDEDYRNARNNFDFLRSKASCVKDINTFWLKDTLYNFGIGFLERNEWHIISNICNAMSQDERFTDCINPLNELIKKINDLLQTEDTPIAEQPHVSFGEHDPFFLGSRQDTYISLAGSKRSPNFKNESLHLVEVRGIKDVASKINDIEKKLLEKSPLQLENKSQKSKFVIEYIYQKDEIIITDGLKHRSTIISISELKNSEITYDKDEDSEDTCISIELPSLTYIMILDEMETLKFKYFINKVFQVC